mmetsp:Transcript_37227/g.35856  ORF Transcript_37227/g.35856 Transcript_37227/m.35856 type:complete len:169 (+) Transcript_37227:350-856(+)
MEENAYDEQTFRREEIWNVHINNLLLANLYTIKKIYSFLTYKSKDKILTLDNAIAMIKGAKICLLEKDIAWAWSQCKQTIIDIVENRKNYYRASFVEFLEFLCRLGQQLIYTNNYVVVNEEVVFIDQLRHILSQLFNFFAFGKLKEFNEEDDGEDQFEETSSDSDSDF